MIIIITLFYLSLATIILMVGWKLVVIRGLKVSLVEGVEKELHGKFYKTVHELWYAFFLRKVAYLRALVVVIFFTVAHRLLRTVGVLVEKVKVRNSKIFDMVKGKGVISKEGSVSFFLRDVAKYKKSIMAKEERRNQK